MRCILDFRKNEYQVAIGYESIEEDSSLQVKTILDIFKPYGGIEGIIDALKIEKVDPETGFDILKIKARREIKLYFEFFKAFVWDVRCENFIYSTGRGLDTYFMSQDCSSSKIIKQSLACRLFLFLMQISKEKRLDRNHLGSYLSVAREIKEKLSELQFYYMEQEQVSLKDLEFPVRELREDKKYWKLCDRIQLIEQLGEMGVLTIRDLISLTERQLNNKFRKKKLTPDEKIDLKDGFHEIQYNLHRMGLRLKTKVE